MTNTHAAFPTKAISFFATVLITLLLTMTGTAQTTWTTNGNNDTTNTNSSGNVIITGNLGFGTVSNPTGRVVVPSGSLFGMGTNSFATWGGHSAVLESANNSIFFGSITDLHMISNASNPANWKYKTTGPAADYYLYNGYHAWRVATSGTAGAALTWTDAMTLTNGGNLGVGTTSPSVKLDVISSNVAGTGTARFKNNSANTQVIIDSAASQNANLRFDNNAAPVWYFGNEASNNRLRLLNSNASGNTEVFSILQGGNVGIGTTPSGTYRLNVAGGNINAPGLCINTVCKTDWSQVGGGSGTITGVTASTGLSGGGTSGSVTLTNTDPGSAQLFFKNIVNGAGGPSIAATANNDTLTIAGAGGTTVSFSGKTVTIDGSTSNISATKVTAGTFGSGNYTFPGNVTVNGNIAAKYQDVAEWVDSSQELTAGTVVVLDSAKNNQVIASTQSYDSRVAGVISAQPGIKLGQEGEGRVLVATTGRVKVRVDASNGPIQIGDLLVTGEKAGMAMKSVPVEIGGVRIHRPGTLIGKALESLASGTGEILVLLSLQ